jgi:hypothetical protein
MLQKDYSNRNYTFFRRFITVHHDTSVAPTSQIRVRNVVITNCEKLRSTVWCGIMWHVVRIEFHDSENLKLIIQTHTNTHTSWSYNPTFIKKNRLKWKYLLCWKYSQTPILWLKNGRRFVHLRKNLRTLGQYEVREVNSYTYMYVWCPLSIRLNL